MARRTRKPRDIDAAFAAFRTAINTLFATILCAQTVAIKRAASKRARAKHARAGRKRRARS